MHADARKLLWDARAAAERVTQFTTGRTFAEYEADDYFRSAVERQFEIIGEALSRLLKADAALAARITNYRRIIDFRNTISHGYDAVDNEIVWEVVQNSLPVLRREVEKLLASLVEPE